MENIWAPWPSAPPPPHTSHLWQSRGEEADYLFFLFFFLMNRTGCGRLAGPICLLPQLKFDSHSPAFVCLSFLISNLGGGRGWGMGGGGGGQCKSLMFSLALLRRDPPRPPTPAAAPAWRSWRRAPSARPAPRSAEPRLAGPLGWAEGRRAESRAARGQFAMGLGSPPFLGRIKIHLQGSGASLMGREWRGSGVGGGRRREKWVGRGQGGYMGTPGASEWVGTIDLEMASQQGTSSPFK